jgi:hypothetical protein
MRIYGAGMAGLLAANLLRRHKPVIHEAAAELPNNHAALLRFRTDAVSRATGIPFRKVRVHKGIMFEESLYTAPTLKLSNLYSEKVSGKVHNRSILNLDPSDRFISPPNFIEQLARSCAIYYNMPLTEEVLKEHEDYKFEPPLISTIPMPVLMEMLGWRHQEKFESQSITSIVASLADYKYDVYQTLYYPGSETRAYRASMVGSQFILELIGDEKDNHRELAYAEDQVRHHLEDFGIRPEAIYALTHKTQRYGKILPIDDAARKTFILHASDHFNIYSVGRFATWRQILLDDVVQDIEVVASFINQRDTYARKLRGEVV